jgi:hypothetical protein
MRRHLMPLVGQTQNGTPFLKQNTTAESKV